MILPGTGRGTGEAGGGGGRQLLWPEVAAARKLRRSMSLPEVILWKYLRGGRAGSGVRFRRQHPVGPYIADFYCPAAKLVVEIDGEAHDRGDGPEHDQKRDAFLNENGYQVLRVSAAEVMNAPNEVAAAIVARVTAPLHRFAVPLPACGEDL